MRAKLILSVIMSLTAFIINAQQVNLTPNDIFDIGAAREYCAISPLDNLEGIWVYPEDKVTVLIHKRDSSPSSSSLRSYAIRVIESEDCMLEPGDLIGYLQETPDTKTYKIELFTERQNLRFLKPRSCLAVLSKDYDTLLIKQTGSPLKFRLNLNFNRLLTGFWKIASIGLSKNQQHLDPPIGMVKLFPSFDGNGSSRRSVRYL